MLTENTAKAGLGKPSLSQNSDPVMKEAKSLGRLSVTQTADHAIKESRLLACMYYEFWLAIAFPISFGILFVCVCFISSWC